MSWSQEGVAPSAAVVNSGDTAWLMVATALVLFMVPGLAMFYGGLARSKNMLGTMMHSMIALGLIMVQWVIFGYSLSFGNGNAFLGDLSHFMLGGMGPDSVRGTVPSYAFVAFQGAFACITPALISGAIAERIRFGSFMAFILLWSTLVYDPVCHWIWHENGFLYKAGVIDFAGGLVVHLTSGIAGLVACIILGKRQGLDRGIMPHNMVHVVLGTGILWFGWFGFNAGSAIAANATASLAFINTFVAPCAGMCLWLIIERFHLGKLSALGAATGAIAGLAAITPAAGSVLPGSALVIGALSACVCYVFVANKTRWGYDDSLDAFGVHGVAGMVGPLACGVFAVYGYNSLLHSGNANAISGTSQFLAQLKAIGIVGAYSALVTGGLVFAIQKISGFRLPAEDEEQGLDLSVHGERAYNP